MKNDLEIELDRLLLDHDPREVLVVSSPGLMVTAILRGLPYVSSHNEDWFCIGEGLGDGEGYGNGCGAGYGWGTGWGDGGGEGEGKEKA